MDIGCAYKELGEVDISPLKEAIIRAQEEDWLANQHRQQVFDVHQQTQSLVMMFSEMDKWPAIAVERREGWNLLADAAIPIMRRIIDQYYPPGGVIIRAMAAKLLPNGLISPHIDKHPSFVSGHRIHLPIVTNPKVRFMIGGQPANLLVGKAYEINNQQRHSVMNKGGEGRVNFIFDYVPASEIARKGLELTPAMDLSLHAETC